MNQSQEINHLAAALIKFQGLAGKIIKKAENPFFKSKYAALTDILDEIHKPLIDAGLTISQFPDGNGLTTILIHAESGQFISANAEMKPVKNDPQAVGSAISYQRRYSIVSILGLNCDEDDDGNKASLVQTKQDDLPWLKDADVQKAIDHVKGGNPLTDITKKYKISKANYTKIIEATK